MRLSITVAMLSVIGFTLVACAEPTPTVPTPKIVGLWDTARSITYDDLFRNSDIHKGQTLKFRGQIVQVLDGNGDQYQFRVDVDPEAVFSDSIVFLAGYIGPRLLEDDFVWFVSEGNGLITYEAVLRNSITIPSLQVIALTRFAQLEGGFPLE